MMKRVLSFLLCLIMVVGLAAPSVQASGSDNVYIDDVMNNIVIDDSSNSNVIVDGQNITKPTEPVRLPSPTELVTEPEVEESPMFAPVEPPVTVLEVTKPAVPALQPEVEELLPISEASTSFEGTIVNAIGIPKGSTLSVENANIDSSEVVDAVEGTINGELFSWDISVQNSKGEDWQPEGKVKMELDMPDLGLHKHAKICVVHVDDNGETAMIEASFNEEGKIVFETPGFSVFFGFTVDFEYNNTTYSMQGMESMLLSDLMDFLKMPLYVEDVVDVDFTDDTLLAIKQQENRDWLLTSLKPFDTTEHLVITMADGESYDVVVTDEYASGTVLAKVYLNDSTYNLQIENGNGVINLGLNGSQVTETGDGDPSYYNGKYTLMVYGPGVMTIHLQNADIYDSDKTTSSVNSLGWTPPRITVANGAKLIVRLGGYFEGDETITLKARSATDPIFNITDGSLYLRVNENYSTTLPAGANTGDQKSLFGTGYHKGSIKMIIDGGNKATSVDAALFLVRTGENIDDRTNLVVEDVEFQNVTHRVARSFAHNLTKLWFTNCYFHSSVKEAKYGGSVIYLDGGTSGDTYQADVADFKLKGCIFNEVTSPAGHGGAIATYCRVAGFTIENCTFTKCEAKGGRGGAIACSMNERTKTNYQIGDTKYILVSLTIKNSTFSNCKAYSHGGAIDLSDTNDPIGCGTVKIENSSFTNSTATNNGGGALRFLLSRGQPVTISNCTFSGCNAGSNGGAIYFPEGAKEPAAVGDVDITDCTFSKDVATAGYGGAICVYSRTSTLDITGGSFTDCKAGTVVLSSGNDSRGNPFYNGNGGGGAIMITRKHGAINIGGTSTKKQTFTNCESLNNGGAIAFEGTTNPSTEIQSCNIQYVEIDGCKARDGGSAICMSTATIVTMSIKDSVIKNCTYVSGYTGTEANKNSLYDELYTPDMPYGDVPFRTNDSHGTIRTNGATKAQLVVEGVTFTNNTSVTGGGGIYWNANRLAGYPADTDGTYTFTNSLAIKNCTFEDNYAFRDGGAIYVEASLSVEGGIFKNNSAERGGAIAQQLYNNSGRPIEPGETNNLIIKSYTSGSTTTKAVFDENYARTHGGAISVLCNATASITTTEDAEALAYPITCEITGAEIKNNRAAENGGGVYFYQMSYPTDYADPSDKTETDIKLDNKEVEGYVKSLKLDGSTIFGNYSGCGKTKLTTPESANGSGHGGGIYLNAKKQTTLQVLGCTVYSNTAHYGNGGGVYMSGEGGVCQIKSNAAGRTTEIGGAANKGNKATSSAPGTTAGQNTGNGGGIGIFIKGRIEMQGGTVSYNTADTSGGGIAVNGSTMEFTNGTVTNNAAKYGGGISLTNSGDPTTIADQSLKNPPALTPAWGMVFTNGTVTYNLADIGGGICISNNSTMKLDGGKVWDNQAATKSGTTYAYKDGQNGGGIAVVSGSKMNVYAGEVKRNHARNGGGITVQGGSSLQMLPKVGSTAAGTVSNNTAHSNNTSYQGCGGGIYLAAKADSSAKNTLYVDHGTISSNTARYGGGIALMQNAEATLQGGSIDHNKGTDPANSLGGGAYVYGGKLTISGAELSYNYGQNSGGAVYLTTASGSIPAELSVTGGTIHHNHTKTGWGGGIYMLGQGSVTTVSGGKIYENYTEESGSNGGGINAEHNCTLNINGGEIYSNRAASNGGGINAHSSAIINIDGGAIYKNTAASDGGGINAYSSTTINIDGGAIYQNTATAGTGGGIYAHYYTTMTITGGDIYSNKAATYGGGMHVSDHSTLTFKGGDIRNNTATRNGGGGITVSWHSNATVGTSADGKKIGKIMNNTAAMGGGLYVECSDLTVRNGYIINNKAVGQPASNVKTAYHLAAESLVGIGGGICLTGAETAPGTFTLTGDQIAIYGNTADFAADDVCSNGLYTQLDIPTVVQMDLADYDFQAEGWVEDYCKDDTHYTSGLNMIKLHADRAPAVDQEAIRNMGVTRFRNTPSTNRKYMLVEPEYVSGKYPNNTAVSGVYANQANAYVCLTLGIPGAADDTVVLDYGTTVNVNLIDNDLFINEEDFQYGELGLRIPNGVNEKYGIHYSSAKNANGTAVGHLGTFSGTDLLNNELSNGTAFLNDQTGIITYNYNYGNGQLSFKKTETFAYTVKHGSSWFYAKITVVPATTIYYEDTAAQVKYHANKDSTENLAAWKSVGQSLNAAQEQDRPGEALIGSLDADNVYGYDGLRANTITYSDGGAHKVTVNRHNSVDVGGDGKCDTCGVKIAHEWKDLEGYTICAVCGKDHHCFGAKNCVHCGRVMQHTCVDKVSFYGYCDICGNEMTHTFNARATFTFTGTGFDIVSACSTKTGILMVNVYKGTTAGLDYNNPAADRYVTTYMVDTYFGHKYENGDWVQDPNNQAFLYQVPVVKADLTKVMTAMDDPNTPNQNEAQYANYGYGTYTVEIYVAPSFLPQEQGYTSAEFYLDAIRIYNPAGAGNEIDSKALETYKNDNEAWPAYAEVRNMLIEAKDVDIENNDGILYVDGATTNKIGTYETRGPNNEVYLKPGHHIAFKMDMSNYGQDVTGIHMAMKGIAGPSHVLVQAGTSGGQKTIVQNVALSTTDMYYDIGTDINGASVAGKVITITNDGPRFISITTVKVTHGSKPDKNSRLNGLFQSNLMTSYVALDMLDAKELAEPSVTPKYPALSYNGMICYNVFFSAEDLGSLTADDLGLAVFDSYDPEGTVETAKDVIMGATQIDGLYMVATNGVNAKYLGDTQYFRAFAKQADGSFVYSKMVSYSAVDYAKNVLAKSNDVKLKQLVVAMLNYGAEAQKFFGYKTDDLMNKDLTADDQALLGGFDASSLNGVQKVDPAKVGDFASTGGFTRRSPAISFNGAFEINYFFTPAHVPDGDMVLYFWNEDTYNSVTELTYDNADKIVEVGTKDGTYTATSDEIIARQLDQTMYVAAVYRSYGETYCSGVLPYSIAAYCQKPPAGVQALATAAAVYGCAAKQFFGE